MSMPFDRVESLAAQLKEFTRTIKDQRKQMSDAVEAAEKLRKELKRIRQSNGKAPKGKKAAGRGADAAEPAHSA